MSNDVFMKRVVRQKKVMTETEKLQEMEKELDTVGGQFKDLKSLLSDLEKQFNKLVKNNETERKRVLASELDRYRN